MKLKEGLSKCRTRYVATVATRNGAGAAGNFSQDFPPAVPEGFTPAPQTEKASGLGSRDSLARDTQKKLQSFKSGVGPDSSGSVGSVTGCASDASPPASTPSLSALQNQSRSHSAVTLMPGLGRLQLRPPPPLSAPPCPEPPRGSRRW